MQRAFREAKHWRHDFVGTEHLLFGLLCDTDGPAFVMLSSLNAMPDSIVEKVELLLQQHAEAKDQERFPLSPALQRVFASAQAEAARFRHQLISPEHLLLGLMAESECTAAQILADQGMTLNELRVAVAQLPMEAIPESQVLAGAAKPGNVPNSLSAADLEDQVMPIKTVDYTPSGSTLFATQGEMYAHLRRTQYALGCSMGFVLGCWSHNWQIGAGIALFAAVLVYFNRFWFNIAICAIAPAAAAFSSPTWPAHNYIFVLPMVLLGTYIGSLIGMIWASDRSQPQSPFAEPQEEDDFENR
jgi:hypothetical protein